MYYRVTSETQPKPRLLPNSNTVKWNLWLWWRSDHISWRIYAGNYKSEECFFLLTAFKPRVTVFASSLLKYLHALKPLVLSCCNALPGSSLSLTLLTVTSLRIWLRKYLSFVLSLAGDWWIGRWASRELFFCLSTHTHAVQKSLLYQHHTQTTVKSCMILIRWPAS